MFGHQPVLLARLRSESSLSGQAAYTVDLTVPNGQSPSITQIYVDGSALFAGAGLSIDWIGNQSEFFAETQSNDDQNYGGYNNRQQMFNLQDGEFNGTSYRTHAVHIDEQRSQSFMANSLPVGARNYVVTAFSVWDTACPT